MVSMCECITKDGANSINLALIQQIAMYIVNVVRPINSSQLMQLL